jgi:hypothetical protein
MRSKIRFCAIFRPAFTVLVLIVLTVNGFKNKPLVVFLSDEKCEQKLAELASLEKAAKSHLNLITKLENEVSPEFLLNMPLDEVENVNCKGKQKGIKKNYLFNFRGHK